MMTSRSRNVEPVVGILARGVIFEPCHIGAAARYLVPGDHSMLSTLMSGFPSKEADLVTLANWRRAPYIKWSFQHVREIVASADVPNAPDDIWKLPSDTKDFSAFRFTHGGEVFVFV